MNMNKKNLDRLWNVILCQSNCNKCNYGNKTSTRNVTKITFQKISWCKALLLQQHGQFTTMNYLLRSDNHATRNCAMRRILVWWRYNIRIQAPREGGVAGPPSRVPQTSRGPMNLKVQNWNEQWCTKFLLLLFYLCSLVQINWLKLLFQSFYDASPHFWETSDKISIVAVSLLAQCSKYCLSCRNSPKYVLDVTWDFVSLNSVAELIQFFLLCEVESYMLECLFFLKADITPRKRSRIVTLSQR